MMSRRPLAAGSAYYAPRNQMENINNSVDKSNAGGRLGSGLGEKDTGC